MLGLYASVPESGQVIRNPLKMGVLRYPRQGSTVLRSTSGFGLQLRNSYNRNTNTISRKQAKRNSSIVPLGSSTEGSCW